MAESVAINALTVSGLLDFLLSKEVSQDVLNSFEHHGIDGAAFLEMNDEHLKEVAPRIGDRIALKKLLSESKVC